MANKVPLIFEVFASDKTKPTFTGIIRSTDTLGTKIAQLGKLAAGAAAAGLAAFAGVGIKNFIAFDDKMNQSLAIMGEISGPMREQMEEAAREVGKTTRFGADQAAEAYFFLASAGLDAEQSIGALPQVAKFATAGMFDLATATDLATDAQSALGLASDDPAENLRQLTRVTDVLVGANTLANASVQQFSTSLTQKAGPALRAANKELEEGVAVLAVFADQGVKGERAGTMLTATLDGLQRSALSNKDAYDELGVAVFDGSGNMRNMADITEDLEGALGSLSTQEQRAALTQLGLNRQTLDGVLALVGMSDQIGQYESDLQEMGGITEEVADKQLNSFAARLDIVKSKVTDVGMVLGENLVNAAFTAGEVVGEMARMFGELPDPVQKSLLGLTAIVTAAPLVVGAWRKVKSAIDSVRLAYAAMGTAARVATLSLGIVGVALAAGATVLAFFANKNVEAEQAADTLRETLDRQTGAVTKNTREIVANTLQQDGALQAARDLGLDLEDVIDIIIRGGDVQGELQSELARTSDAFRMMDGELVRTGSSTAEQARSWVVLKDSVGGNDAALREAIDTQELMDEAVGEGADAQGQLAGAADEATGVMEDQVSAVDELIKSLDSMVESVFAARDAERGYEKAVDDATAAVEENGATLDINTEKGRENQDMLDGIAEAALKDAAATLEDAEAKGDLAAGHEKATEKMEEAREEFIRVAQKMGLSKKEAKQLATELGLIPGNYKAKISTPGLSAAERNLGRFRTQVGNIPRFVNVNVGVTGAGPTGGPYAPGFFAEGGLARKGQLAVVGERGPELVAFEQDAHVFSTPQSKRIVRTAEMAARGGDGAAGSVTSSPQRFVFEFRGVDRRTQLGQFVMDFREALQTNPAFRVDVREA